MAKILIAEDDASVRELIRHSLERDGHEIVEAASGPAALALAKQGADLLILDVMLPGMDGHTLQMELARDPATYALPVIVVTAIQTAHSLFDKFPQVKAVMSKPFKPADLSRAVSQALAGT